MTEESVRDRLAVLVHEVRSPVAALSAIAQTVREPGLETTVRRELVDLAIGACRAVRRIVSDLVPTSIVSEPVDLARLVRDAATAATLGGARIDVCLARRDVVVDGDPVRLRQALDNLLANALVHGGDGPVTVTLSTERDASGVVARVAVADAGPGIPVADRERIFERGVRLDESRTGSGLGLAVARAVAEGHGGRLELEGPVESGSTFVLTLPLAAGA